MVVKVLGVTRSPGGLIRVRLEKTKDDGSVVKTRLWATSVAAAVKRFKEC